MAATVPFSEMPENWINDPEDLGRATLAITIALAILSVILVALRTWARFQTSTFAVDDGLMVVGLFIFIACCVATCKAVYAGLGTHDIYLKEWNSHAGTMYIVYFQITYAWSLPFIKASICLTMLRIITEKVFRIILWVSLVSSVASAMIGFVSVVALCTPLPFYWDKTIKNGWCADAEIVTGISYLVSVMSIVTDWSCAILPCFVVWRLQMAARLKISVCSILALGMVASAATIIRIPYLPYYNDPTNYLYNVANIIVWSIVECGLGIICGSLPSLRSLMKSWLEKSYGGGSYGNNSRPINGRAAAGGSIKMGNLSRNAGYSTNVSAPGRTGTWVELDDDTGSEKRMITRTVEVSVDIEDEEMGPGSSRR